MWIYMDLGTGEITTRRAPQGLQAEIRLESPPEFPGAVVVGIFIRIPTQL
jgi:hypothetical protein